MSLCGAIMVCAAGPAELPPFTCGGDLRGLSGAVAVSAKDQIFGFWTAGAALFSEGGELTDTALSLSGSLFDWAALMSREG